MFGDVMLFESEDEEEPEAKLELKKRKCDTSESIHSSLDHHTIRAPPLVEYNSIDSYCEKKRGESHLTNHQPRSGLNNLQSFSSPIIFKTPKPMVKIIPPNSDSKPYVFFSVEELSLVKSLKNWSNTKVTAVGKAQFDASTKVHYLKSVAEADSWRVLLDTLLLREYPDPHKLLQIYGVLQVADELPRVKVNFLRYLGMIDLPKFVDSYKLMQRYIPEPTVELKSENHKTVKNENGLHTSEKENIEVNRFWLSDTLDCCDFSNVV